MEGQEHGDEETRKMLNIYSFASLLSFTAGAGGARKKNKKQKANGPGCKDAGLPSLVHQPASQSVGLDGIRQLLRMG